MNTTPRFLVPAPQDLEQFASIHPKLPLEVVHLVNLENRRDYSYALTALICGAVCFLGVVGAFVYLVMQGHGVSAGALLGAGILGIVGSFIRARLRTEPRGEKLELAAVDGEGK